MADDLNKQSIANNSININSNIAGGNIYYTIDTRVCPRCEEKLLNKGFKICNHCRQKEIDTKNANFFRLAFMGWFIIFGILIKPDNILTADLTGTNKIGTAAVSALLILISLYTVYKLLVDWLTKKLG